MADGAAIASTFVTMRVTMPGVQNDIRKALGGSAIDSVVTGRGKAIGAAVAGAVAGGVAAVTSKAINLVMGSIDKAVSRVDTMNAFPRVMKNLGYETGDARKAITKLSDGLKGLPTSLNSITSNVQRIAPSFSSLDAATNTALALNNALLAGGSPLQNQEAAFEQYSQAVGRGKFEMEEWRSLQTAMPGQLNQVAQSLLGASGDANQLYEAMKSGQISMGDFNGALVRLNSEGTGQFASFEKQALDATDGIGTGWANLQTAITRSLANIIQKLKPMIDAFLAGATQIANALGPVVMQTIDMAVAVVQWTAANKDWLVPAGIMAGTIAGIISAINLFKAAQLAWAAAMGGAQIATFLTGKSLTIYNGILKAQTIATNIAAGAKRAFDVVMAAGPIGLVVAAIAALVAGLVWFFTQTETGKKLWAEFTRFLGEAWANISSFFQDVWNNVLKPVFEGIGQVLSFVWNSILKPVFDGIAAVFQWIWTNIVSPIIGWIQEKLQLWGLAMQIMWTTYVKPALDALGVAFQWIWQTIISPVVDWIKQKLDFLGLAFRIVYEQYIRPAWDAVSSKIQAGWAIVKNIIDTMVRVVQSDPKRAFEAARDAIGTAWAGIQELAKKPVRFVVDTVINGLIDTINLIPGVNIPRVSLPKGFAGGGVLPGYMSAKRDDVLMPMRSGEGVLVPEVVRGLGPGFVHALNAVGNTGGVSAVRAKFGQLGAGLARGGLVTPLPAGTWSVSQPYHGGHNGLDMAAPSGTPVMAAADGVVGLAGVVPMGGNEVYIQHTNGLGTRYSHLSRFASRAGNPIRQGQVLGYVGSTGMSTGPHLHYMVHAPGGGAGNYGNHVNPAAYLNGNVPMGGEAWNPLTGLIDFVTEKIKGAFPEGGMWVDAAAGLAKDAARRAIEVFTPKIGADGHTATLYDTGGWLPTGMSLVENRSGRPEPILTGAQWDSLLEGRNNAGDRVLHVYDSDGVLLGTMKAVADERIDQAAEEQDAAHRLARF